MANGGGCGCFVLILILLAMGFAGSGLAELAQVFMYLVLGVLVLLGICFVIGAAGGGG